MLDNLLNLVYIDSYFYIPSFLDNSMSAKGKRKAIEFVFFTRNMIIFDSTYKKKSKSSSIEQSFNMRALLKCFDLNSNVSWTCTIDSNEN